MGLKPLTSFLGLFKVEQGVAVITKISLLFSILTLCVISSRETLKAGPVRVSAAGQVVLGAWAFIGIPLSISASVASVFRNQGPQKAFMHYLLISVFLGWFTLGIFFLFLMAVPLLYSAYVFWSAVEEIEETKFPKQGDASDFMNNAESPEVVSKGEVTEDTPLWNGSKLESDMAGAQYMPPAPPTRVAWMMDDDWRRGTSGGATMESQNFGPAGPPMMGPQSLASAEPPALASQSFGPSGPPTMVSQNWASAGPLTMNLPSAGPPTMGSQNLASAGPTTMASQTFPSAGPPTMVSQNLASAEPPTMVSQNFGSAQSFIPGPSSSFFP